jgi:hypothetical protein
MHPEGGFIGLPTSVEKKESYLKGNLHIIAYIEFYLSI